MTTAIMCWNRIPGRGTVSNALPQAGSNPEECRLARAVAPNQGHALAGTDGKLGALEQRRAAEGEVNIAELEKGRGGGHGRSIAPAKGHVCRQGLRDAIAQNGGRDRDRTCDPSRVKGVRYRCATRPTACFLGTRGLIVKCCGSLPKTCR